MTSNRLLENIEKIIQQEEKKAQELEIKRAQDELIQLIARFRASIISPIPIPENPKEREAYNKIRDQLKKVNNPATAKAFREWLSEFSIPFRGRSGKFAEAVNKFFPETDYSLNTFTEAWNKKIKDGYSSTYDFIYQERKYSLKEKSDPSAIRPKVKLLLTDAFHKHLNDQYLSIPPQIRLTILTQQMAQLEQDHQKLNQSLDNLFSQKSKLSEADTTQALQIKALREQMFSLHNAIAENIRQYKSYEAEIEKLKTQSETTYSVTETKNETATQNTQFILDFVALPSSKGKERSDAIVQLTEKYVIPSEQEKLISSMKAEMSKVTQPETKLSTSSAAFMSATSSRVESKQDQTSNLDLDWLMKCINQLPALYANKNLRSITKGTADKMKPLVIECKAIFDKNKSDPHEAFNAIAKKLLQEYEKKRKKTDPEEFVTELNNSSGHHHTRLIGVLLGNIRAHYPHLRTVIPVVTEQITTNVLYSFDPSPKEIELSKTRGFGRV